MKLITRPQVRGWRDGRGGGFKGTAQTTPPPSGAPLLDKGGDSVAGFDALYLPLQLQTVFRNFRGCFAIAALSLPPR